VRRRSRRYSSSPPAWCRGAAQAKDIPVRAVSWRLSSVFLRSSVLTAARRQRAVLAQRLPSRLIIQDSEAQRRTAFLGRPQQMPDLYWKKRWAKTFGCLSLARFTPWAPCLAAPQALVRLGG